MNPYNRIVKSKTNQRVFEKEHCDSLKPLRKGSQWDSAVFVSSHELLQRCSVCLAAQDTLLTQEYTHFLEKTTGKIKLLLLKLCYIMAKSILHQVEEQQEELLRCRP